MQQNNNEEDELLAAIALSLQGSSSNSGGQHGDLPKADAAASSGSLFNAAGHEKSFLFGAEAKEEGTQETGVTPKQPHNSDLSNIFSQLMQAFATPRERIKMVLCVRRDLGMGIGKIAAQCSHATLGIYKHMALHHKTMLEQWEGEGCAKIVVKLDDEKTMLELQGKAAELGLPSHIVMDAGKTQIVRGTRTVLAVAGPISQVDKVTGQLKLL